MITKARDALSQAHLESHQAQTATSPVIRGATRGGAALAIPRFQLDFHSFRDLHKIRCIEPSPTTVKSRFACYLAIYFPEAAALIDESDFGILHLEVGVLKLASRDAIAKGDWDTVSGHFAFVTSLLDNGGGELRNALSVSYLGSLFYGETSHLYAKARALLPRRLSRALESIERHYQDRVG